MLARARPAPARPDLVPARRAGEGRDARRSGTRPGSRSRGAPRARRRASSPATTTARSSARHGLAAQPGTIVDETGAPVGRHDGFWRFTPGQRRGLGVAAPEPLYALATDARTNTVVAGPRAALARTRVSARGRLYAPADRVAAKLRYRSPGGRRGGRADGRRLPAAPRRARVRRRARAGRRALRRRRRGRFRVGDARPALTRLATRAARLLVRRSRRSRPRDLPHRGRARGRLGVFPPRRNVRPAFFVDSRDRT